LKSRFNSSSSIFFSASSGYSTVILGCLLALSNLSLGFDFDHSLNPPLALSMYIGIYSRTTGRNGEETSKGIENMIGELNLHHPDIEHFEYRCHNQYKCC
jgi:hypothetical protein